MQKVQKIVLRRKNVWKVERELVCDYFFLIVLTIEWEAVAYIQKEETKEKKCLSMIQLLPSVIIKSVIICFIWT